MGYRVQRMVTPRQGDFDVSSGLLSVSRGAYYSGGIIKTFELLSGRKDKTEIAHI